MNLYSNEEKDDIIDDTPMFQVRIQPSTEWKDVIILKLIIVTSVMLSLFISESLTEGRSYPLSDTASKVAVLLVTLFGLISMVVMFCLKNKMNHFTSKQDICYRRPLLKRTKVINLKKVVSIVFMIGTLCYQILNLIHGFYCRTSDSSTNFFSYFVVILFCILQQHFCIKFKGLECNSSLTRCSVTFMLEVNISMCLGVLVRETFDIWKEATTGIDENRMKSNQTEYGLNPSNSSCFNRSSSNIIVSKVIGSFSPNLYPVVIEYSVMTIQNLFSILALSSNKQTDVPEQDTLSKRHCYEMTPLIENVVFKTKPSTQDTIIRRKCKCRCSFLFGLVISIPFGVVMLITFYTTNIVLEWINDIVYTIFTFSLLFSSAIGLVLSLRERNERDKPQVASFRAGDIIYFITVSSTTIFHSFSLIASFTLLNSPISTSKTSLYFRLLHEIFMFLGVLFQTLFLRKCKTRSPSSGNTQTPLINEALTFVAVCNAVLWFVNSFYPFYNLANPNHAGITDIEFYGMQTWALVFKITVPLAIYYRLHSVLLCLGSLSK